VGAIAGTVFTPARSRKKTLRRARQVSWPEKDELVRSGGHPRCTNRSKYEIGLLGGPGGRIPAYKYSYLASGGVGLVCAGVIFFVRDV